MVEADVESRLTALEEGQEWLTHKIHRTDDRMDRVWAQTRTFVINSDALEEVWIAHPDPVQAVSQGDAGNKFLKELAEALDFPYPLTDDLPPRDEQRHGRHARDLCDSLHAIQDEIRMRGLVKLEAEYGGEDRANRKAKCFTLVWRFGAGADRIERHISTFLNAALAEANRTKGGGKVQCWRDKTRGEKRRRAQARQDREGGEGGGADAGKGKAGRGKGKVAGDGRGRGKGKAAGRGKGKGRGGRKGGRK